MLALLSKKILLGTAILGFSTAVQAAEVLLWQIPDHKGKPPTFYKEPSKSSKSSATFKPNQTVQVVSKQKDWAKIAALDHSGQTAFIPLSEVQGITTLTVDVNQSQDSYLCNVLVRDPKGRETGNWRMASRVGTHKDISMGKQANVDKVFQELDDVFNQQRAVLSDMMGRLFQIAEESESETKQTNAATTNTEPKQTVSTS